MRSRYSVGFFVDLNGSMPVADYIYDGKNLTDLQVIINVIQRLAYVGQAILKTDMADHIDGPIYELRKGRHRILYAQDGNRFVLLCAFIKKTQKTPEKEIETAYHFFNEYSRTKGYFELQIPDLN